MKFPTARNSLIGTRKTDSAAILIASKKLGRMDTHLNVVYTRVGQPAGAQLSDTVGGALAAMVPFARRFRAYGEVLATTSTGGGEGDATPFPGSLVVPEAAGQELVGTVGIGVYVCPVVPVPRRQLRQHARRVVPSRHHLPIEVTHGRRSFRSTWQGRPG